MDEAIKDITIPFLRHQGFKGSYPHFRKIKDDRINLLTFQFNKYGGSFVVEISNCSVKGIDRGWGNPVKPSACTAHDMNRRLRLGSYKPGGDHWFDFSKELTIGNIYTEQANAVIASWPQAEKWWQEDQYEQRLANVPQ